MILLLTDKSADFDSLLYDFKTLCMRYDILDYHTLLMFGATYTIVYAYAWQVNEILGTWKECSDSSVLLLYIRRGMASLHMPVWLIQ